MLEFMDYVQAAFYSTSRWNVDNSYASLTTTASNILDFPLPHGILLHISSLSAPNFATSYTLGSHGVVDGSLSFLYSSLGLKVPSQSSDVQLSSFVRGYRHIQALHKHDEAAAATAAASSAEPTAPTSLLRRGLFGHRDTVLYGRLYLPGSTLNAMYMRRTSPTQLLRLNCVSDSALPNGGTVLALLQNDYGKYSTEYLYSTDSSLLGVRGLYNFGHDPRVADDATPSSSPSSSSSSPARVPAHPWDHQNGRLSAGAEVYFSPVNKSGGLSTGLRFATLPVHTGFPYTMTLTVNPLMGNLSSSYAVKAGANLALCSRFDFNVYSYESDVVVGMELWRRRKREVLPAIAWAESRLRPDWARAEQEVDGVLKARMDNHGKVGLLWECRVKDLLLSLGAGFDMKQRDKMIGRIGLEVSYSS